MTTVKRISIDDVNLDRIISDNSALTIHIDLIEVAVDLITIIRFHHLTTLLICGGERNVLLDQLLNNSPDLAYSCDITSDVLIQPGLNFCLERDTDQILFACENGSMTLKEFVVLS